MKINSNNNRFQFQYYIIPMCFVCLLWVLAITLLIVFMDDFPVVHVEDIIASSNHHQEPRKVCDCPRHSLASNNNTNNNDTIELDSEYYRYLTGELLQNAPYPGVDNYTLYTLDRLGLDQMTSSKEEPIRVEYGPVVNDVTSFRYLRSVHPCWNNFTSKHGKTLFVAIISAPGNMEKRESIRNTWLSHLSSSNELGIGLAGYAFIVGRTQNKSNQDDVDFESNMLEDIIQVDMMDSYYNLTLKVTGLLNWLNLNCQKVDFVLKVDDDIYVNVRNLAETLPTLSNDNSMYGYRSTSPPLRGDKWYISYEAWPWSHYPPFFMGAGIVMSGNSITSLLAAAQTTPFMPFDDVYLTGLCSSKAGVQLFTSERIFDEEAPYYPHACFVRDTLTWLTHSVGQMRAAHQVFYRFYSNATYCPLPYVPDRFELIIR